MEAMSTEKGLAARLDEDEAAAKAAVEETAAAWRAEPNAGEDWWAVMYTGPSTIRPYDEFDYPVAERVDRAGAAHIALNDPARALRFIAAVRAIIRESSGEGHGWAEHEPAYYAGLDFALIALGGIYDEG